ncbi:hypothetical protein CMK10_10775 [Candidatus Poribacteria bacterium]|nr:hypothetical protein [Candidatus Poribacteria bacterium]
MKYILFLIIGYIVFMCIKKPKKTSKRNKAKKPLTKKKPKGPPICPYCKEILENRPKRNKKCPSCQHKIIIRRGKLLTESQAEEYDKKELERTRKAIERQNMKTLISYQKSGIIKYVEILAAGQNSCSVCKKLDRKKILLKNELRKPTLPVKNCTGCYGFCRCCYSPVV